MNSFSRFRLLLILCAMISLGQLQAQHSDTIMHTPTLPKAASATWEAGLMLGAANPYGDLVEAQAIQFKRTKLATGGFVRYSVSPYFSLRASYLRAKLEGADQDWESLAGRGLSFESTVNELALVGQWSFLGQIDSSGRHRIISPYVFGGLGVSLTDLTTNYSSISENPRSQQLAAEDMANSSSSHFIVPFGLGANIGLNERLTLSLEYGVRPVFNDYLDGVSALGNPDRNDWYSMANAGLAYRMAEKSTDQDMDGVLDVDDLCPEVSGSPENMGCPDSDRDGIVDHLDLCPTMAGSHKAQGCPDADGDGVADAEDNCPQIPGSKTAKGCADTDGDGVPDSEDKCASIPGTAEFKGCRDSDNDGVADPDDRCPYEKGEASADGCPPPTDAKDPNADTDGDGIVNSEDECPYLPGLAEFNGCQDGDGDGVADHKDRCPYEKGPIAYQGCPTISDELLDTDGDGVVDKEDNCPELAGDINGCPDTDADGLTDDVDACPEIAGPGSRGGCPELSAEDARIIQAAVDNVSFLQGSFDLISSSHTTLDKVAEVLNQYPSYKLKIEGHTDNQGDVNANQRLSEQRARACYNYLHEEGGVAKSRMTYVGYGGEQPRTRNDSEAGRRRNRRVEFILFE